MKAEARAAFSSWNPRLSSSWAAKLAQPTPSRARQARPVGSTAGRGMPSAVGTAPPRSDTRWNHAAMVRLGAPLHPAVGRGQQHRQAMTGNRSGPSLA